MSKAFKCNICNTCFDPYGLQETDEFTTIPEFYIQTSEEFQNGKVGVRFSGFNACPECTRKFQNFIEGRNLSDTTDTYEMYLEAFENGVLYIVNLLESVNIHVPVAQSDEYYSHIRAMYYEFLNKRNCSDKAPERKKGPLEE